MIDATRMRWTILEGGSRVGESAEEWADRRTIAPGIEFVGWTEKDGTTVVQVVDLNAMRVTTARIVGGRRMVLGERSCGCRGAGWRDLNLIASYAEKMRKRCAPLFAAAKRTCRQKKVQSRRFFSPFLAVCKSWIDGILRFP